MTDTKSPESPESEDEITQALPEEELAKEGAEELSHIRELEVKVKDLEDKYLRTYADFDNFRKRVAREKEEVVTATSENLLREFLEVKDHLEQALTHASDSAEIKSLREGVELTLKQLRKYLEKAGVEEINALGEPFDPTYHEAIHQEKSAEYKPGTVVHEYQRGYLFRKKLLRPSRVTVAT